MTETAAFILPEDGWFNIAVPGEFMHKPTGLVQVLDQESLKSLVDNFTEKSLQPHWPGVLIDFDHQSLDDDKPSVAAGWITALKNRPDGIWAQIRWSDIGRKSIEGGRYRFISPVWKSSDCAKLDGDRIRPLRLMNCAITNAPNIVGLSPLSNTGAQSPEFSPPPIAIVPPAPAAPRTILIHNSISRTTGKEWVGGAPWGRGGKSGGGGGSGGGSPRNNGDSSFWGNQKADKPDGDLLARAIGRATTFAAGTNKASSTNAALAKIRADKKAARTKNRAKSAALVAKAAADQAAATPKSQKTIAKEARNDADTARHFKALGFIQDAQGNWKTEYQMKSEGYRQDSAGNWAKPTQSAPQSQVINPATQTYSPQLGRTVYNYMNRRMELDAMRNYISPTTGEEWIGGAPWGGGGGGGGGGGRPIPESVRNHHERLRDINDQIQGLENGRPEWPGGPDDFSKINIAEVRRQAMATPGNNSADVLRAVREAQQENARRRGELSRIKRDIKKTYKSGAARDKALAKRLAERQKDYENRVKEYHAQNAKIDAQIAKLEGKRKDEQLRADESNRRNKIKSADQAAKNARAEAKAKLAAQVRAENEAAKQKAREERAAAQAGKPQLSQAEQAMKAALARAAIRTRAAKEISGYIMAGTPQNVASIIPNFNVAAIDSWISTQENNSELTETGFRVALQQHVAAQIEIALNTTGA